LGRHASISGSSLIQCASDTIARSSFQEEQNARHHNQFKVEQALVGSFSSPKLSDGVQPPSLHSIALVSVQWAGAIWPAGAAA
jgi:hypothetical protein